MKRIIEQDLLKWKENPNKKPLVIFGSRQIGKTYTVAKFGKEHYKDIAVFNFEGNEPLQRLFVNRIDDPDSLIVALSAYLMKQITAGTLIFFDEIQACPKALTSLKYFCEKAPQYNIIAAGSLLGVVVNREHYSFPVGKIDRLSMYPMNFYEFLQAMGEDYLCQLIEAAYNTNQPLQDVAHDKALQLYKTFLAVGGMPEVVKEYIATQDSDWVKIAQRKIVFDYSGDMVKYASKAEAVKISSIFNSMPSQLAKENRKFKYSLINSSARASSYEVGLDWLISAGIVNKVYKAAEGKMPLKAYMDMTSYKVYLSDVGLLAALSNIPLPLLFSGEYGGEAKGGFTENYVCSELIFNGIAPYYWESNNTAEVDFVAQIDSKIVPIEVKAADNVKAKSLAVFKAKYETEYSIRISAKNFGMDNNIKSVPLYAVWCINDKAE